MKEREVSFRDIIVLCLRKWRILLACTLVGLLLGGLWAGVSFYRKSRAPEVEDTTAIAAAQGKLDRLEEEQKYYEEYLANSIYINLEWGNLYEYSFRVSAVAADSLLQNVDYAQALLEMEYERIRDRERLNSDLLLQQYYAYACSEDAMKAACPDISERYARELITADYDAERLLLQVSLCGADYDEAVEMGKALADYLTITAKPLAEDSVGAHRMRISNVVCRNVADTELRDAQNALYGRVAEVQQNIDTAQIELDALKSTSVKATLSLSSVVKRGILGALVGLVLCCTVLMCAFVFDTRIIGNRQLNGCAGLPYFGDTGARKKALFDRWVAGLAGEPGKTPDAAERNALVASNILQALGDKRSVLLLTTVPLAGQLEALQEEIRRRNSACSVAVTGDPNYEMKALEQVKAADAVVLCERLDRSRADRVAAVLACVQMYGKTVIGYVMV